MHKKEVLVDTAFLGKLSCDGKNIETFKKVLSDLKFKPVVHPYIAANELDMYSYFDSLVAEGFVLPGEGLQRRIHGKYGGHERKTGRKPGSHPALRGRRRMCLLPE